MKTLRAQLHARRADKVPPGWITSEHIMKRERVCKDVAHSIIRQALACKPPLLERRDFLVVWGATLRRRPHYRYL